MGIISEFFKGFFVVFRIIINLIELINEQWDDFYYYTLKRGGYIDIFEQIAHVLGILIFIGFTIFVLLIIFCIYR